MAIKSWTNENENSYRVSNCIHIMKKKIQQIEGKFYPLQHEEWMRACHELTSSEKDVLYYIRTIDPYSNGIQLNAAAIARDLSTEAHKVCRQTVSRALKKLDKLNFIDLELITFRVKVKGFGVWEDKTPMVCEDTTEDPETPQDTPTPPSEPSHTSHKAKPSQGKGFKPSKTNKESLDHKENTVSIFEKFEEQLRLYGIRQLIWKDDGLAENPKLLPILKALQRYTGERAERAIAAFLKWIRNAKNVDDPYKALELAIVRGWA